MKREFHLNRNILLGIVFVAIGIALLSYTAFDLPLIHSVWPPVLIFVGGFFIWRVFFLGENEILLFFGMICAQAGFLGLFESWFSFIDIYRIWPIFLFMAGLTLLPHGFRKRRNNRVIFIIPGFTFIFLAGIFLPFSLGLAQMSFMEFVNLWWPLLFVFLGILLLANHIGRNIKQKKESSKESGR